MDILGALPQTKNRKVFIIVTADRILEMTRGIPTLRPTATHVANVTLDQWIVPNNITDDVLTDNGPQFVSTFITKLSVFLHVNHFTATAYHLQTNAQVEW